MAQNKGEYAGYTGENYPLANAPVWTVPSDAVPNSDERILLANNNQDIPNYDTLPIPSAPEIGDLPPNYFDISIVPNNVVLHYNEVVPYTEPSKAIVERKNEGVVSFDPLIDRNPDQLWLYFMTYLNEKPSAGVNIHGYHVEVGTEVYFYTFHQCIVCSIIQHSNDSEHLMAHGIHALYIILVM
jgi:hypothetical protein